MTIMASAVEEITSNPPAASTPLEAPSEEAATEIVRGFLRSLPNLVKQVSEASLRGNQTLPPVGVSSRRESYISHIIQQSDWKEIESM